VQLLTTLATVSVSNLSLLTVSQSTMQTGCVWNAVPGMILFQVFADLRIVVSSQAIEIQVVLPAFMVTFYLVVVCVRWPNV
jgi:hypothetical protein